MNQQQNTKSTMKSAQKAIEFPMDQAIEYQSNLGRLVLSGLTMSDWMQSQGIEMTRRTIDNYLRTLENATEQISQSAAVGVNAAQQTQQEMTEMAQTQPLSGQQAGQEPQPNQRGTQEAPAYTQPPQQPGQQVPQQQQEQQMPQQQPGQQMPQQEMTPFQEQPQQMSQTYQPPQQVPQEHQYQQEAAETSQQDAEPHQQQENPRPIQPQR